MVQFVSAIPNAGWGLYRGYAAPMLANNTNELDSFCEDMAIQVEDFALKYPAVAYRRFRSLFKQVDEQEFCDVIHAFGPEAMFLILNEALQEASESIVTVIMEQRQRDIVFDFARIAPSVLSFGLIHRILSQNPKVDYFKCSNAQAIASDRLDLIKSAVQLRRENLQPIEVYGLGVSAGVQLTIHNLRLKSKVYLAGAKVILEFLQFVSFSFLESMEWPWTSESSSNSVLVEQYQIR